MASSDSNSFRLRVLLVDDDPFALNMISGALRQRGCDTYEADNVAAAIALLAVAEPNLVITDLELGSGPDGSDLLNHIATHFPWIAKVVLTSHASPQLGLNAGRVLPPDTTFLVKSSITVEDLYTAVDDALESPRKARDMTSETSDSALVINHLQGEILKLMAMGLSNTAIAHERGTSIKSVESGVHRLFSSLGLDSDTGVNQRVLAVRLWQQGRVVVK